MNDVKVKTTANGKKNMEKLTTSISITWNIEDIRCIDETLTDGECSKVLNFLKEKQDAEIGINWDVIRCTLRMLNFQFPKCSCCGEEVESGYIFEKNNKFKTKTYFCSEKCLKEYFPDEDMNKYNSNYHSCIERVSSKLV